ncbi:hypothetical protein C0989_002881 [Termitomyces sp. Mn162]|nr:hypothetical protein C0989_002881 [Termitomyces sp. Mn162]
MSAAGTTAVKGLPMTSVLCLATHLFGFYSLNMPDIFQTSGPATLSTTSFGAVLNSYVVTRGRNYDYTKIYSPDKEGDELKENARVWNVCLDEAENYDADMIQGLRNIINGLLVFVSWLPKKEHIYTLSLNSLNSQIKLLFFRQ